MFSIRALIVGAGASRFRAAFLAQTYPSQNVTVIIAFPAGGLADMIARLVSTKLENRLKHSFVVENRGGAGGNIAAKAVAGAAPDGYTLLATTSGLAANLTASKNHGFEQSDLRPVAFVAFSPDVIAVHPSNPAKDLKNLSPTPRIRASPTAARASAPARKSAPRVFLQGGRQGAIRPRAVPGAARRRSPHHARQSRRCAGADDAAGDAAHQQRRCCAALASPATSAIQRPGCADLWRDGLSERLFRFVGRLLRAWPRRRTPWCKSSTSRSTR